MYKVTVITQISESVKPTSVEYLLTEAELESLERIVEDSEYIRIIARPA